jgi:hypothetical protein
MMIRTASAAAGLAAGIVLAASPATAALASPQPFSLSVSPGRMATGAAGSVRELIVANNGTKPVTVRAELTELSRDPAGRCAVGRLGTLPWAAVKPLTFTLRPGGHQTAKLTISRHVPGGIHDLVAAFVAVPGAGSGVAVSGAVGAQMQVQGNGATAATHACLAVAAPPKPKAKPKPLPAAHSSSWTLSAIAAGLVAVIAALLAVILRQRRRIRASAPNPTP